MIVLGLIAYVFLIFLAYAFYPFFGFVRLTDLFIFLCVVPGPMVFVWVLADTYEKGVKQGIIVFGIHLLVAIAIHPAVEFRDPVYLESPKKFDALRNYFAAEDIEQASYYAELIASSTQADLMWSYKHYNPVMAWLFPPSLALLAAGAVAALLARKQPPPSNKQAN